MKEVSKITVIVGSDHAGFTYKGEILSHLEALGYLTRDVGTHNYHPVDYPDIANNLAEAMRDLTAVKGILICGSGVGVCITINKYRGIRAGVCHDAYSAHQGVEHDDMNVLCLGQRIVGMELAKEIVQKFIEAEFSHAPRHQRRLDKILSIERQNLL
ncbi:MAG: ribose 5-phosphate isomerase B [Saprospiraceae bacterium]|nr:ribose 5-phosphate isomerase B [Saprospiraceae bacterium]